MCAAGSKGQVPGTTASRLAGGRAAARAGAALRGQGQCHGLLELLVAPVQLLHLGPVLRPRLAQLPQEVLVGTDQGTVENTGQRRPGSAAVPLEGPALATPSLPAGTQPSGTQHSPALSPAQAPPGPHTCPHSRSPLLPSASICPWKGWANPKVHSWPPNPPALPGSLSRPPQPMAGKTFSF